MINILLTGVAGFIGSHLARHFLHSGRYRVVGVDKLTYAGSRETIADLTSHPHFVFVRADICDGPALDRLFTTYRPRWVWHLAAESHVDRSIDQPAAFIQSNIVGTWRLLEAARDYWHGLEESQRTAFRLFHTSTDEVFGSLRADEPAFTEASRYDPHSPYAASKAAADHLVRAWFHTYGLPTVVTHSCNNYGPWQYPEKLIPVVIGRGLRGEAIPLYGAGDQRRSWLHVADHCRALESLSQQAPPGSSWNIGSPWECSNLELVQQLCHLLDEIRPAGRPHAALIKHVADRPGHDWRYALDSSRIQAMIGWQTEINLDRGLRETVRWYYENRGWWESRLESSSSPTDKATRSAPIPDTSPAYGQP